MDELKTGLNEAQEQIGEIENLQNYLRVTRIDICDVLKRKVGIEII